MSKSDLTMAQDVEFLHEELRTLIEFSRQRLSSTVNAELSHLYWMLGHRLHNDVLGGERAQYGRQIMSDLGRKLAVEYGRGFEVKNLIVWCSLHKLFPIWKKARHCHEN